MQADRASGDAGGEHIVLDHLHYHEEGDHLQHQRPGLKEADQHRRHRPQDRPHHRDQLEQEGEHADQKRVVNAEEKGPEAGRQADDRGHRQLPPNVGAEHLAHGLLHEAGLLAPRGREEPRRQAPHPLAVDHEPKAQDQHQSGVHHARRQRPHNGHRVADERLRPSPQRIGEVER